MTTSSPCGAVSAIRSAAARPEPLLRADDGEHRDVGRGQRLERVQLAEVVPVVRLDIEDDVVEHRDDLLRVHGEERHLADPHLTTLLGRLDRALPLEGGLDVGRQVRERILRRARRRLLVGVCARGDETRRAAGIVDEVLHGHVAAERVAEQGRLLELAHELLDRRRLVRQREVVDGQVDEQRAVAGVDELLHMREEHRAVEARPGVEEHDGRSVAEIADLDCHLE